jgi:hypothetical protein
LASRLDRCVRADDWVPCAFKIGGRVLCACQESRLPRCSPRNATGRAETLERDVLEDVRDPGEPEVRQCHDGVTLLGEKFRVPFLNAAFGAAEQDDTGEDGGRVRVEERPTRPSSCRR